MKNKDEAPPAIFRAESQGSDLCTFDYLNRDDTADWQKVVNTADDPEIHAFTKKRRCWRKSSKRLQRSPTFQIAISAYRNEPIYSALTSGKTSGFRKNQSSTRKNVS